MYERKAGEILHPEREPLANLEGLKLALGSTTFSAQYQQCPVPSDGEVVKWGWFRRYAAMPTASSMTIYQSWDTASKAEEHHDFSVCTTWGTIGDDLYLLDLDRARLDFPGLKRRVIELAQQWRPRSVVIEDKGAGTALIQPLRSESHGIPYPAAFTPKDDKVTRLHAQSGQCAPAPYQGYRRAPCQGCGSSPAWVQAAGLPAHLRQSADTDHTNDKR